MRFKTYGTTVYELRNVREPADYVHEGEDVANLFYRAELSRISDHGIGAAFGSGIENTADFFEVYYGQPPKVGECFWYSHPLWGECRSSEVTEIYDG